MAGTREADALHNISLRGAFFFVYTIYMTVRSEDPVPSAGERAPISNSLEAIRDPLKIVQSLFTQRASSLPASSRDFGVEDYFMELMKDADVVNSVRLRTR